MKNEFITIFALTLMIVAFAFISAIAIVQRQRIETLQANLKECLAYAGSLNETCGLSSQQLP